jgi:hypothetical protein
MTSPSSLLTNSSIAFAIGDAVDSHGNVFVSYNNQASRAGRVVEFRHGQMPGKRLHDVKIRVPGAPLFDRSDNLIVVNQLGSAYVWAPPYTGTPRKFHLKGYTVQCSFDRGETTLACGDYQNFTIDVYAYPSGTYLYSFNNGLGSGNGGIDGVAFDPSYPR